MDIVFLGVRKTGARVIRFGFVTQILLATIIIVPLCVISFWLGASYNKSPETLDKRRPLVVLGGEKSEALKEKITVLLEKGRKLEVEKISRDADLALLSQKIGQMQAHIIRLNALGGRLTKIADIDEEEFIFDSPPPQGGVMEESKEDGSKLTVEQLLKEIKELENELEQKGIEMDYLQGMFIDREMDRDLIPTERPIKGGWISSYFGKRSDPFTGKKSYHKGVDFAAKRGTKVHSAASGIVIWSGYRGAYGNTLVVDHGNGYTTRYAHNKKLLVKEGDRVEKGQLIALMGSTGRSTAPHVHFEVRKNDVPVNPLSYLDR